MDILMKGFIFGLIVGLSLVFWLHTEMLYAVMDVCR